MDFKLAYSYFKKAIFHTLASVIKGLESKVGSQAACKIRNFSQKFRGNKVKFFFDKSNQMFVARDNSRTHFFPTMSRGFGLYSWGIGNRSKAVAESYFLSKIDFSDQDVVIDCGANFGDLGVWLSDKIDIKNYIAFEPAPKENLCLKLNFPEANIKNCGLGNNNSRVITYLNSENADTSYIKPKMYTEEFFSDMITLNHFINHSNYKKVKLLKLEAEGFEPEIIDGACDVLHVFEYIAIDGGFERGKLESETFSQVSTKLIKRGFDLIATSSNMRGLFKQRVL